MSTVGHIDCDEPVTTIVKRTPKPGMQQAFEDYIRGITAAAVKQPGYLGCNVFRPDHPSDEYQLIYKFDSMRHFQRWENSEQRQHWHQVAAQVTQGHRSIKVLTGLETWFTLPGGQAVIPPPKHKMAIIIWLCIFPIITLFNWLTDMLLPNLAFYSKTALITLITVPLMTYVLMPRLSQLFHNWLHR